MQAETLEIPPLRRELAHVHHDLETHGIALLENALSADRVMELSTRLHQLAFEERESGVAFLEDGNMGSRETGPNQRVLD